MSKTVSPPYMRGAQIKVKLYKQRNLQFMAETECFWSEKKILASLLSLKPTRRLPTPIKIVDRQLLVNYCLVGCIR